LRTEKKIILTGFLYRKKTELCKTSFSVASVLIEKLSVEFFGIKEISGAMECDGKVSENAT